VVTENKFRVPNSIRIATINTRNRTTIVLTHPSILQALEESSISIHGNFTYNESGDRIPVVARIFAHVQTGHGDHPASCTMGTVFFPGLKRPERGADHPPPSSAEVMSE
jgi:hypothetical protein